MKNAAPADKSSHLSLVPVADDNPKLLSRAQVAERLGVSVATVRRNEGTLLNPQVDKHGAHWFDPKEVTALAASRANQALARGGLRAALSAPETRTRGELAALVFERFEQRQSHAEIVIGLRIEPELVRELFTQWCLGLTEGQLQKREPHLPLQEDIVQVSAKQLAERLETIPGGQVTRISIGRWRGIHLAMRITRGSSSWADSMSPGHARSRRLRGATDPEATA
jgi:hypothetical protein